MQFQRYAIALLALVTPLSMHAQSMVSVPSVPLYNFQHSLGVNTHINYTDGNYANYQTVIADLNYLGISNVRDSLPNPGYDAPSADTGRRALAAAGIFFDFLATCNQSVDVELAGLDEYARDFPGSIITVEGTNEINNAPCPGGTQDAAVSFQRSLYAAVHADPNLKGVPVMDFTGGAQGSESASLAGQSDVIDTHPYPADGQMPFARLMSDFNAVYGPNYTKGVLHRQITETGYQSTNYGPNGQQGEDELSKAEMLSDAYFDALIEGNTHIYIYQLLQAYPNATTNGDTAYGLFNVTNQPGMFAQFLHNIHTMLPPDSPSRGQAVHVEVSGTLPSTAHMLATTTSNRYAVCPDCVALWTWNEAPEYDTQTHQNIVSAPITASVQMPGYTAVAVVSPEYSTLGGVQQSGNSTYADTIFGFPTAILFKHSGK